MGTNEILSDLNSWFNSPQPFYGVVIYQRPGFWRRVAVGAETREDYVRLIIRNEMPFGALPSDEWKDAIAIGSAKTFERAVKLLFPGESSNLI